MSLAISLVLTLAVPADPSDNRFSTFIRSCYRKPQVSQVLATTSIDIKPFEKYLEAPSLLLELLIPIHPTRHVLKILLYLLAETHVEACDIRESGNTKIKV